MHARKYPFHTLKSGESVFIPYDLVHTKKRKPYHMSALIRIAARLHAEKADKVFRFETLSDGIVVLRVA